MNPAGLALVLTGGGARAAYQVGILRFLAETYPTLAPEILTGVSAGGILATHLAARTGGFAESVDRLSDIWYGLEIDEVFRVDTMDLAARVMRWGMRLMSGGAPSPRARSMVDTSPLRGLLMRTLDVDPDGTVVGIQRSLDAGRLRAVALTASSYTTGQSITWVQARPDAAISPWERPQRAGRFSPLRVDHVMASSALPFFFPAITVDGVWCGDGGIRLVAPLSPAIHLGARKILAVPTRFHHRLEPPAASPYPPPAQVAGVLLNAVFLDLLDSDALRLEQFNRFIDRLPPEGRDGLRHIDLLVLRPSQDLGQLANTFEARLPTAFRFLVRGLGSREARSNDMLSLLMFQHDYIARLIDLGEADARARADEIAAFMAR